MMTKAQIRKEALKRFIRYNIRSIYWNYTTLHLDEDDKLCGFFKSKEQYADRHGILGWLFRHREWRRNRWLAREYHCIVELMQAYER